tara:strand:- start:191 stop:1417 length:1227 start_codon:yes stop_codon:yes gene_type:complete
MKKVLIVNQFACLPEESSGTRHYSLSKYFSKYNWKAFIIAGSIEHSTSKQRLRKNQKIKLKIIDNVTFFLIKLKKHKSSSLKFRIFNMILFFIKLISTKFDKYIDKPDVIIGSTISPLAALGALIISWRYGVPFIYEVRDLWPETLIEMNLIKRKSLISFLISQLDIFLAKRSLKTICLMPFGIKYYMKNGISKDKLIWIPNGVEEDKKFIYQEKIASSKFKIIYLGSHGPSNALKTIIYAVSYLKNKGINLNLFEIKLIGDGPIKDEIKNLTKLLKLSNIVFEDSVPKSHVQEKLKTADALVLTMNNLPKLYQYGISFNKIFDYFYSGRPILMTSCASYNYIEISKSGLVCPAEDYKILGKNILKMMGYSNSQRKNMGLRGREYVLKNFLYNNLSEQLVNTLNNSIR